MQIWSDCALKSVESGVYQNWTPKVDTDSQHSTVQGANGQTKSGVPACATSVKATCVDNDATSVKVARVQLVQ